MRIIGFGHRKRVGKDTSTQFAISFARQYRPDLRIGILSFGDIIKHHAYHMYSWGGLQQGYYYESHEDEIEVELPRIGKSPRQIWDSIGNNGRDICDRTWVQLALQDVDSDLLFCKDVRGFSEFDLIRAVNGLAIRVTRKNTPLGGTVDSILENVDWNLTITNDEGKKELNAKVVGIVKNAIDTWFPKGV